MIQPEQEPVAWMDVDGYVIDFDKTELQKDYAFIQPLYTAPPRKEWVGLTDEEIDDLDNFDYDGYSFPNNLARAIEAKLKEKNSDPR